MPKQNDGPGTGAFEESGRALWALHAAMTGYRDLAVTPVGMSIRAPYGKGDEYLVTIRGVDQEGAPLVAWHGATTLMECIAGVEARLRNGTLKWKVDEWAQGR